MSNRQPIPETGDLSSGQNQTHLQSGDQQSKAKSIPRVSIQIFCEDQATADISRVASEDRRLSRAHISIHIGGIASALAHYEHSPTPNLIIVESTKPREQVIKELDLLANVCDSGTNVIVIGHSNDVQLYRDLLDRGVTEYLIAPLTALQLMESISNIYHSSENSSIGNVTAFIGSKGGVGSSTICHNVSWMISNLVKSDITIVDFDLAFGTAGLNFNQDPAQGLIDALGSPDRLDEVLLDRLLTKCSEHLSLFAAPASLYREYDISADACDIILDVICNNIPFVSLDLPHVWTQWSKKVLLQADEIVITATPDLASLRNTKNLLEAFNTSRKNDSLPLVILNKIGIPKRPEITAKDFSSAIGVTPFTFIEFTPELFGAAENNGQMIEEASPNVPVTEQLKMLACHIAHYKQPETKERAPALLPPALAPLLDKFKLLKLGS